MALDNLIFGNYVTSATFCLKLGKGEISALARLNDAGVLRQGLDASFWALAGKGLIATNSDQLCSLTEAGKLAVAMLNLAGLTDSLAKVA